MRYKCAVDGTISSIFATRNKADIAREMTRRGFPMTRGRMARIVSGELSPRVHEIPPLAEILRVDVGTLTNAFAKAVVA